ncbi:thialysine N-epsilon-acetyltransferase-like [Anticarsia gemmatalis]|uniref:thialysine N-epsilon-acetyltransferase-like n=1 Tax=Anticarsia gemmatalis TaxID=129554 RepID=UPI003F75C2DE
MSTERAESAAASAGDAAADGAVSVRPAAPADVHHILDMIHELAAYEGEPHNPKITVDELLRDGLQSSSPWFFALVAECGGAVVGHALCNRAYSSATGRAYYVEDLFVRPAARRRGVGLALLRHLCRMAVREGVRRVDWHVLETNAPALAFYARLGARDLRLHEGRAALRLYPDSIDELAAARD